MLPHIRAVSPQIKNKAISRQKSFMPSWLVEAQGRVVNFGGISTTAVKQKIFQEFDVGVGSQA